MTSITRNTPVRILGRPPVIAPRRQVDGSYLVDSRTATLVAYKVKNLEHGWACECPAGAFYRACWHVTAVLQLVARTEAPELADDLAAIADYMRDGGGDDAPDPEASDWLYYSDGTRKPYNRSDSHTVRTRKAQESWSWDDGEVA